MFDKDAIELKFLEGIGYSPSSSFIYGLNDN